MSEKKEKKLTPSIPDCEQVQTVEEMKEVHNLTQNAWEEVRENFSMELKNLHKDLELIQIDLENLSLELGGHWREVFEKLKNHEEKLITLKSQLDGQLEKNLDQDKKLEDLKIDFHDNVKDVKEEIIRIRGEINENRKERRADITDLNLKVEESFKSLGEQRAEDLIITKQERKEENWGVIKQISALMTIVLAIIVPILVALLYLIVTATGGKI